MTVQLGGLALAQGVGKRRTGVGVVDQQGIFGDSLGQALHELELVGGDQRESAASLYVPRALFDLQLQAALLSQGDAASTTTAMPTVR